MDSLRFLRYSATTTQQDSIDFARNHSMISDSLPRTLACFVLSAAFLCQAEPPPSAVQGKILDASRTPIPGATVTATTSGRAAG